MSLLFVILDENFDSFLAYSVVESGASFKATVQIIVTNSIIINFKLLSVLNGKGIAQGTDKFPESSCFGYH